MPTGIGEAALRITCRRIFQPLRGLEGPHGRLEWTSVGPYGTLPVRRSKQLDSFAVARSLAVIKHETPAGHNVRDSSFYAVDPGPSVYSDDIVRNVPDAVHVVVEVAPRTASAAAFRRLGDASHFKPAARWGLCSFECFCDLVAPFLRVINGHNRTA